MPIKYALYATHDFFTSVVTARSQEDFYSTMKYAISSSNCSAAIMMSKVVVIKIKKIKLPKKNELFL